jgi:dihydrofolate reductase
LNKPVLMGRKTWESLKGALPQRDNLVLTRDARLLARNAWSFASLDAALACALGLAAARGTDQVCVIGGGEIYRATLPYADAVELTEIDCAPVGDATFPELDPADWRLASETASPAGEGCEFAARFLTFRRNRQA